MRSDAGHSYIWRIVERFYRSRSHFLRIHDRYEEIVAGYVEKLGIPRTEIRLQPRELSQLLSYKELEVLRDDYVLPLKDACHALFRTRDSTEFLDRVVNDIFHELSILKEEHYNVLTYDSQRLEGEGAADPRPGKALAREQQAVLDEVHDVFPQKVHRLRHLYEVALRSLERLLPNFRDDVVLIRSLFLHRDRFVARAYETGLIRFYELMYGEDAVFEGFRAVGDSFYDSGFHELAILCYEHGEQFLLGIPPNAKRSLDPRYKEAREHFRRNARRARQQLESIAEGSEP